MSDALLTRIADALEGLLAHVKADVKKIEAKVEAVEDTATGKKGKKAAATVTAAATSTPSQTLAPAAAAPAVASPEPELSAPAVASPEPGSSAPPKPTITKDQLNKAVLKVASKNRDGAVAILARFGASNTVTLPEEKWQAVYDAFEEEIAKIDAAAVQVAQASLV